MIAFADNEWLGEVPDPEPVGRLARISLPPVSKEKDSPVLFGPSPQERAAEDRRNISYAMSRMFQMLREPFKP